MIRFFWQCIIHKSVKVISIIKVQKACGFAEVCLKSYIFLDPDIGPLQGHANSFIYWCQSPGHVWTMNMDFGGQSLYQTAAGDCHTLVTSKHAKLWADPAWSWWSVPMAPRNFLDSMWVILWENKVARSPHQSWWLLADPSGPWLALLHADIR